MRKGTGLWLSIRKAYVDLMGGTLEVESELGKESLFRVRLPAEIAAAADDNRENLLLLKSLLEVVGFFVLEAKNGKEAMAVFKKEWPDLI